MTWTKLDDRYPYHRKTVAAGLDGNALYIGSLCHANAMLTDGIVPEHAVASLTGLLSGRQARHAAAKLLRVGRWHDATTASACPSADCLRLPRPGPKEYLIHEFLPYQEPAERVRERRQKDRERVQRFRERHALGNALPADPVTPPPTRPDPEDLISEPVSIGLTLAALTEKQPLTSENDSETVLDLTRFERLLDDDQRVLLRKICRSNPKFADLKPRQLQSVRTRHGNPVLTESLRSLVISVPEGDGVRPAAYLGAIVDRVATDFERWNEAKKSRDIGEVQATEVAEKGEGK